MWAEVVRLAELFQKETDNQAGEEGQAGEDDAEVGEVGLTAKVGVRVFNLPVHHQPEHETTAGEGGAGGMLSFLQRVGKSHHHSVTRGGTTPPVQ